MTKLPERYPDLLDEHAPPDRLRLVGDLDRALAHSPLPAHLRASMDGVVHEHMATARRTAPTRRSARAATHGVALVSSTEGRGLEFFGAPTRGGTTTTISSLLSVNSQLSPSLGCSTGGMAKPEEAELAGGGLTLRGAQQETLRDGQPGPRVLVVDDEESITELVATALRYEGFQVEVAESGRGALTAATSFRPHLIVLDIMLPDLDGFEVQRRLAADRLRVPILFLTARDTTEDKVHGLTMGADDYVTKPFSLEELVARVHAVLRRSGQAEAPRRLQFADLELDEDTHEVWRGGAPIELSATEFNLLRYLLLNARRVLSKAQIVEHVWRYDFGGDPRIVENYISYLRKKVDFKEPQLIHTVRGVGYSLRLPR